MDAEAASRQIEVLDREISQVELVIETKQREIQELLGRRNLLVNIAQGYLALLQMDGLPYLPPVPPQQSLPDDIPAEAYQAAIDKMLAQTYAKRKTPRQRHSAKAIMIDALRQSSRPMFPAELWALAEVAGFSTKQDPDAAANYALYAAKRKGELIDRLATGQWIWVGPPPAEKTSDDLAQREAS